MASYLVVQNINSAEYGGGPILQTDEGVNLAEVENFIPSWFDLHDGDEIDIYRITTEKHFNVNIRSVTSLV